MPLVTPAQAPPGDWHFRWNYPASTPLRLSGRTHDDGGPLGPLPSAAAPHVSEYVKQFFRTVYYTPAEMVVFTSGKSWKTIAMPEGVRQGDATASFCYCIALDVVVTEIKQRANHEGIEIEDILIWMDDTSTAHRRRIPDSANATALAV